MRARRRYHRLLGLILALPLLWLCLTGVILNHSAELRLDQRYLSSPFLTSFYLEPPSEPGFRCEVGSRRISGWGGSLFLDAGLLPFSGKLVGASELGPDLLVATREHLYLLGPQGELIDSLDEASLPGIPIEAIQTEPSRTLKTAQGVFRFDEDLLEFSPQSSGVVIGARLVPLSKEDRNDLQRTLASETPISFSRVLLDLHKFAFLGGFGKWVLTLSTVGLIVVSLTGLALSRKKRTRTSS
ncbi:MAG: PepSY domain-containing protein [Roseibacillus sp.]